MAAAYVLSARQQLLFQVTQAYFGLQLAQENLAVVQQARRTADGAPENRPNPL